MVRFDRFAGVPHGISTRRGGVSSPPYATLNLGYSVADEEDNVAANRELFAAALGTDMLHMMTAELSHGNEVSVFDRCKPDSWPLERHPVRPGAARTLSLFRSDGVVSDQPGLYFMLTFADCVPLLFYDPVRAVIGAAHAGWRGTALGVGPAVIRAMQESFGSDPGDIVAAIGPSIGPCCYRVGAEVPHAIRDHGFEAVMSGRNHLDLWATNEQQMIGAGVRPEAIDNHGLCTGCDLDTFFSYRAEQGTTGRMALGIGL